MNVLLKMLAEEKMEPEPTSIDLKIEDNIGESIHIHLRNIRLEMTVEDFVCFSENIKFAKEGLENGNC